MSGSEGVNLTRVGDHETRGGACAGDGMATDQASAPLLLSGAGTGQGGGTFSAYFTLEIHCVLLVELVLITTTVVK